MLILQNKFKVIASRVMQYRVKEEIKVRKQEMIEEVKCFRCQRVGHLKWECPNIEVKKKKRREKEVVCMARPQKAQQERRPVCSIQRKIQEYYKEESMPPKGTLLLEREQITREIVVAYVNCGGCKGKRVQIHKNQGQGFLLKKQVRNIQCSLYQEAQNQREGEAKREKIMRVECIKCRKRDTIMKKMSE